MSVYFNGKKVSIASTTKIYGGEYNVTAEDKEDGTQKIIINTTPTSPAIVPTGTIDITENERVDVTKYAFANVNVGGAGGELPEYMSAKNFIFNGNACIGYTGNNDNPEIIIPTSYSTTSTTQPSDGLKILDKYVFCEEVCTNGYFVNAEFSDGASHTTSYSDLTTMTNRLVSDFPNNCYLVSMLVERPEDFNWINWIPSNAGIIQYPINVNGQTFNESYDAFNYIFNENLTDVNFSGDIEVISYIDGDDYQVTGVSCIEPTVSGFKNYKNRIILLSNITAIDGWAFQDCTNLTSIEIPSSVTSMGVQIFYDCSNLKNVVLPEGITEITTNEFGFCRSLTSITIPSSVTSIGIGAFSDCTSLTTITIPENVTSIGNQAFRQCSSLTTITIPESVKSIGRIAFYKCTSLTSVTLEATTPPTIQSDTFDDTVQTFYVPAESVEAYKTATNWANYADKIFAIPTV